MWKNYDPEAEKAKAEAEAAVSGEVLAGTGKVHEFVVTEVIDGARIYIQQVSAESAGLEELVNQLTDLSVSEGTGLPLHTPRVFFYTLLSLLIIISIIFLIFMIRLESTSVHNSHKTTDGTEPRSTKSTTESTRSPTSTTETYVPHFLINHSH